MANTQNGNSLYIDSTGAVGPTQNVLVTAITVTPSGGAATAELSDNSSPTVLKFNLQVPSGIETQQYFFEENPVLFPNGVNVTTLTNAIVTVVFKRQGQGR